MQPIGAPNILLGFRSGQFDDPGYGANRDRLSLRRAIRARPFQGGSGGAGIDGDEEHRLTCLRDEKVDRLFPISDDTIERSSSKFWMNSSVESVAATLATWVELIRYATTAIRGIGASKNRNSWLRRSGAMSYIQLCLACHDRKARIRPSIKSTKNILEMIYASGFQKAAIVFDQILPVLR